MYIRLNLHLHTCLFRSAQRRALCDNELLHFHGRWKMCRTPCSAPPFSGPPRPLRPTIYPSAPSLASLVSNDNARVNGRRSCSESRQWKKTPHLLHQYCSLTWWKPTPTYSIMSLEERIRCLHLTCQHCYPCKLWRRACFIIHGLFFSLKRSRKRLKVS